ncbi:MAG: Multifunctional fusion protein [Bacteroidetes bacterium]|nr:Multifunctional fusion protein [Bacteroidota bacterium]
MKAIYAFSGDPITFGHIHIIKRAAAIFPELIVGIGVNPAKKYLFTLEERLQLAKEALSGFSNISVVAFRGLLVDYAFENNIPVIIRGLRNSEDFNMELMLHQIGESQDMHIETLFLPSGPDMGHISSGAAKALQSEQGFVSDYVPLNVKQKLEEKISGQFIVGVTGEIGSGKSYICNKLAKAAEAEGIQVHVISIDRIGHSILESLSEPLYKELRGLLSEKFGDAIRNADGFIDTKALGKIIFSDRKKLDEFNSIIYKPLLLKLRRELYGKKGLILLDSALIAESNMAYLCNNNVLLLHSPKEQQLSRLEERGYSAEQLEQRINSQYSYETKLACLQKTISESRYGKIYRFVNDAAESTTNLQTLLDALAKDLMPLAAH